MKGAQIVKENLLEPFLYLGFKMFLYNEMQGVIGKNQIM